MVNLCLCCPTPAPYTWYCKKHTLQKEAAYALYDVIHNTHEPTLKRMALERLLAIASYRQFEGD